MKFDITRLPVGEMLIAFLLAATVGTFAAAFLFQEGGQMSGTVATLESPTPAGTPLVSQTPSPGGTPPAGAPSPELVRRGQELAAINGCLSCHSITGEVIVGPSWKGLFGREETLVDGTTVTVDEAYIRESIADPGAKVVQGFSPAMPSFATLLSEEEIQALIAFIQSVK